MSSEATRPGAASDLDDEQDDAEELSELRQKIEAMAAGSEERKMAAREWKRLKRIPAGSVENGVVRNYVRAVPSAYSRKCPYCLHFQLDWLTSLPWPTDSQDLDTSQQVFLTPDFLLKARAQLEADHYGMEKIKRRLIEYLAVIRLKCIQATQMKKVSGKPLFLSVRCASDVPHIHWFRRVEAPERPNPTVRVVKSAYSMQY